jgi:hypothetical protein
MENGKTLEFEDVFCGYSGRDEPNGIGAACVPRGKQAGATGMLLGVDIVL